MTKGVKDLIVLAAGVVVSAAGSIFSDYKMKKEVEAEVAKRCGTKKAEETFGDEEENKEIEEA